MKSKWQFHFVARNFEFEKTIKYRAKPDPPVTLNSGELQIYEFDIEIVPNEKKQQNRPGEQIGMLYITLQGRPEITEQLAHQFASMVAEKISFEFGDFRIKYGLVACERILETEEEKDEIGKGVFSVKVQLEEVVPEPVFKASTLTSISLSTNQRALISQFNETKNDRSPIRRFLGFFRILESIFHIESRSLNLKQAFKSSQFLRTKYEELQSQIEFEEFIDRIVDDRHRCAHLKLKKEFGYVPIDPGVLSELLPLEPLVAHLAYISIKEHDHEEG